MTPTEFQALTRVSRETIERLKCYAALICQWQARVNLVGQTTLFDLWQRHFWDSAQLLQLLPDNSKMIVDIGSGAGLPGLVLAILRGGDVHLVESNVRKGIFLHEAARITGTSVTIHTARAERLAHLSADVVTARAVAPLEKLLPLAAPFLSRPHAVAFFLKGRKIEKELMAVRKIWRMAVTQRPSLSDPSGIILCVKEIRHV